MRAQCMRQVVPEKKAVKVAKSISLSTSWFIYNVRRIALAAPCHRAQNDAKLLVSMSGVNSNTIQILKFQACCDGLARAFHAIVEGRKCD